MLLWPETGEPHDEAARRRVVFERQREILALALAVKETHIPSLYGFGKASGLRLWWTGRWYDDDNHGC